MAKFIGIYNNKGGVGKTTLTLFLADFLSSMTIKGKKAKVLVMDFDSQSSCSNAILGLEKVNRYKNEGKTLSGFLKDKLFKSDRLSLDDVIFTREENRQKMKKSRKVRLGNLDVMISDASNALEFEESVSFEKVIKLSNWLYRKLSDRYDFIFIDLPGNISKRDSFSLVGAFMADFFIIPIEPNRINTNAIPMTKNILDNIKLWSKKDFKILGFVLNKADRRTKQYKLHKDEITQFANMMECKIYENILPPTPKLADASDDSIEFITLADRYDNYYTNVRKLVIEILADLGYETRKRK